MNSTKLLKTFRLSLAVLAATLMLTLTAPVAQAQPVGTTDIDITLPDIVILHYFTDVDISITADALGTFLTGVAGDQVFSEGVAAPAAGGFTQDLGIGPSALPGPGDPSAALLTLQNAWAVRSISLAGSTDTTLTIAVTDPTLTHSGGGTITITSAAVDDGTSNGASISFAAPGLVNAEVGDVELTLNLTSADAGGDYVDGVFTLTAENL
ncbi:MAG: hypothetical protein R3344_04205 [Acidobacteriota bacterium]|nr:hypothetical protein [Acidobacteriota bacterium]